MSRSWAAALPACTRRGCWRCAGAAVVLVERRRIGWGASGRNGGFVGAGFAAALGRADRKARAGPCAQALRPVAARRGDRARGHRRTGPARHPHGSGQAHGLAHRPGRGLRRSHARAGRQARRQLRAVGDRARARADRQRALPPGDPRSAVVSHSSAQLRAGAGRPTSSAAAAGARAHRRASDWSGSGTAGACARPAARSRRAMSCWRATPISAACSRASRAPSCRWRPTSP